MNRKADNERLMKDGVRKIRSGVDPECKELQEFVAELFSGLYRLAEKCLGYRNCPDVEDKATTVAARLYKKLIERQFANYNERQSFWSWLGGVVSNECSGVARSDIRHKELLWEKQQRIIRENPYRDARHHASQRETKRIVREGIATLPKHNRVALKAMDIYGWPRERASRLCKVSPETISNWACKGRVLLATYIRERYSADAA